MYSGIQQQESSQINVHPKFGVVKGVTDEGVNRRFNGASPGKKRKMYPAKRFFADNLHHRSQVAIFGTNLKNAAGLKEGGQMFFDPSYQSEYKQHFDENAKQNVEKFLREHNG